MNSTIHIMPGAGSTRVVPNNNRHTRKNEGLQILRAIAALLVVYAHSIDMVEAQQRFPKQIRFYYLENFGTCGVDIFFAISGFILSTVIIHTDPETPNMSFDFMMRRFIRILPIYWILSLYPLASFVKRHKLTPGRFINSFLLLPSLRYPMHEPLISVGWTLIFEMFFYYVLAFNLLAGRTAAIQRAVCSILLLIGLGAIWGFQRPVLILVANPMNIEFVLGCCIALLYSRLGIRRSLGVFLLFIGGLMLGWSIIFGYGKVDDFALVLNGEASWYRVVRWGIPAAILTSGVVFCSPKIRSSFGRIWVYLGDASYSIYLTSVFTLLFYGRLYHFAAAIPPDLHVFIALISVALIGSVIYSFVERPITQSITRIYKQAKSVRPTFAEPVPSD
jgi:exopolysaccharide production protein ExoZ